MAETENAPVESGLLQIRDPLKPYGKPVGIDLGTTHSLVAYVPDEGARSRCVLVDEGATLLPSVVHYTEDGSAIVGREARARGRAQPLETIASVKRFMGRAARDCNPGRLGPYRFSHGPDDASVRFDVGGKHVTPIEVSAEILKHLRRRAEAFLDRPVGGAVITVPAYFDDAQRQATKDAGRLAGLEVLRLLNEPTAAALAYGLGRHTRGKIVVFDLGGGTFDVSVLEMSKGVFEVLATGGDTFLGGEDFDNRIIEWLVFGFAKENGVDLRKDAMALQRLKDAAEKAKHELSSAREARIDLPFLFTPAAGGGAIHLQRTLPREKFDELTSDLVERTVKLTERTLSDAKVLAREVVEVVLVGGQTRTPKVQEAVKKLFGREPCKGVHPDEVVALGASLQADALVREESGMLLLDVTPQSLGIMIAGGYASILIPKNTTVPTSANHTFTTVKDGQTSAKILVLQGDEQRAEKNELLGEFLLGGLRAAARGEVEIEVQFDISAEGIVSVSAKDKETGQAQSITVTATSNLSETEIREIIEHQKDDQLEQKQSEEVDKKRRELEVTLGELDALFPDVRDAVRGSEFGKDAIAKAQRVIASAREAIGARSLNMMAESGEQLQRTVALFKGVLARAAGGPK